MFVSGRGRGSSRMPCESCAVQFSIFRLKRLCLECGRFYCAGCMRRGGGSMCGPCRALCTRPLSRHAIAHLRVRDLQCFLHRQNVSTRGCVEKEELVSLCVAYVNSTEYRRSRGSFGSSLKGFTNNINNLIHSAFDIRTTNNPQAQGNCYNRSHAHGTESPRPAPPHSGPPPFPERFTTTPGGEADIIVPVPSPGSGASTDSTGGGVRLDSADCFEVEDLDDTWELLHAPGEALPNDSTLLLSTDPDGIHMRSSSEVELSRSHSHGTADSTSLHEEALHTTRDVTSPARDVISPERDVTSPGRGVTSPGRGFTSPGRGFTSQGRDVTSPPARAAPATEHAAPPSDTPPAGLAQSIDPTVLEENNTAPASPARTASATPGETPVATPGGTPGGPRRRLCLEALDSLDAVEALGVRQLKELLARSRVDTRGCLERADLLDRARTLWNEHAKYKDQIESLPLEECCKICMAAPLECVLLECGHIATCTACAAPLHECPICRRYVSRAVRFFRS